MRANPIKIVLLSIIFFSCTPTPNTCPALSLKKPNFYIEEYLTYNENISDPNNDNAYSGRCSTYELENLSSIRQYKNGYDHGKWKFYHNNGQLEVKGKFNMGKRIGEWRYYYEDGKLMQISNYLDGNREGRWLRLDKSGDTIWARTYSNNKLIN